jgi:hypothetical protein
MYTQKVIPTLAEFLFKRGFYKDEDFIYRDEKLNSPAIIRLLTKYGNTQHIKVMNNRLFDGLKPILEEYEKLTDSSNLVGGAQMFCIDETVEF